MGLCLWAVSIASGLHVIATTAQATSCLALPKEGSFPPHLSFVGAELGAHQTDAPCGLVRRAQQIFQNKRDLEAGLVSEEETAARGGTALTGEGRMVVLPALYANSGPEPWNVNSLEVQLFVFDTDGTLNDYYREISSGAFGVDGVVQEWVRVSGNDTDYEGADNGRSGGSGNLLQETLNLNDGIINFGNFDSDGPDGIPNSGDDDGFADHVFIVHPEMGAECGGSSPNIWSHQYFYDAWFGEPYVTNDPSAEGGNIKVNRYAMVGALSCNGGMIENGIFAHEYGHALGIPDLYDTDSSISGDSNGIGFWGLMGAGNWNTPTSPAHMDAFSKYLLGWLSYFPVDNDLPLLCLPPVADIPVAAQVWSFGMPTTEYFLVENRQRMGFDANLPAEGYVIYHIDEEVYVNNAFLNLVNADETHKAIDVECADAFTATHTMDADDLDANNNRGDAGDPWCLGGTERTFNALSIPDTRSYSGVPTPVAVKDIGSCSSTGGDDRVCATFNVGASNPVDVCIEDCPGDNCNEIATCTDWWGSPDIWIDNDEDGSHDLPAAGIENKIWTRVHNLGPESAVATTVQLYLAPGAVGLEWPTDAADYLGVTGYPVLDAGESGEDYLIFQYPDLFELIGHYCIGAVIQQTEDPTFPGSASLSNNIAQVNSQVLIARPGAAPLTESDIDASSRTTGVDDASRPLSLTADHSDAAGACPGPFVEDTKVYIYDGYNPTGGQITAELRIGSHPDYDDAILPDGWILDILPDTGPFQLSIGQRDSVVVRFRADAASHGERAFIPLTLWDLRDHRVLGGTTITCEIDCFNARAPMVRTAEWTELAGDNPTGPSVLVEWDPVTLDTNGGPERVMFYEVYRSDDRSTPEALIDRVAIDAEPGMADFQWYDDLPRADCPIVYTYRVRAVDPSGHAGAFSQPIDLQCEIVSADGLPFEPDRILEVYPNPVPGSQSATIRYSLSEAAEVDLSIFGAGGQRVRKLYGGVQELGSHEFSWDGRDDTGRELPSGVYYCRIEIAGQHQSQEVIRIR